MKRTTVAVLILAGLFIAGFYVLNTAKEKPVEENVALPAVQDPAQASTLAIGGYVINRGQSSANSMKANVVDLDVLIGDWAHFDGTAFVIDDQKKQEEIIKAAKQINKNIELVGMINNYLGGWKGAETTQAFIDQSKRNYLISEIVNFAKVNDFNTVALDFENLPDQSEDGYLDFLNQLSQELGKNARKLWVHLYFKDNHDYGKYAQYTDRIILMGYDQHNSTTSPGPISGKTWLVENLDKVLSVVPKDKVALGFGSYAYDWVGTQASSISYSAAVQIAEQQGKQILFDQQQANSYFEYTLNGQKHNVWLVDRETVAELTKAALNIGVRNIFIYRFGSEDQRIWQTLKKFKGK